MSNVPSHWDIDQFRKRVLQDAFTDARAVNWLKRAQTFENARPRPGDFPGRATPAQIAEQDRRLAAAALACRNHAWLIKRLP